MGRADDASPPTVYTALQGVPRGVAFDPSGRWLAAWGDEEAVTIRALDDGTVRRLGGHGGPVVGFAFSPDGRTAASNAGDGTVRVWSLADGAAQVLRGQPSTIGSPLFSSDGATLATQSRDGAVRVWPVRDPGRRLRGHEGQVYAMAYASSSALITLGDDLTVRRWDLAHGDGAILVRAQTRPRAFVLAMSGLVAMNDERAVYVWDEPSQRLSTLTAAAGGLRDIALLGDARCVYSAATDGVLHRWDLARDPPEHALLPQHVARLAGYTSRRALALTAEGPLLALDRDGGAGETLVTLPAEPTERAYRMVGAPNGAWALCRERELLAWAPGMRAPRRYDFGGAVTCYRMAIAPDGRAVYAAQEQRVVGVNLATGTRTYYEGHDGRVHRLRVSSDGRWLVTACTDRTARAWDTRTGAEVVYAAHDDAVIEAQLSPDGCTVASVSADGTVWAGAFDPSAALAPGAGAIAARVAALTTADVDAMGALQTR